MRKLKRANEIISSLAKKNKYISPITKEDFPLFESFFAKEPHTYGNSWTYVTQGMYGIGKNNLGYKYYDGENLSAVSVYPKIENPDLNVFYWIRPMGEGILDIIDEFSKNLLDRENVPTYAKKLFEDQYKYLKKRGFQDVDKFPWHSTAPAEDDTYPERILDVRKVVSNERNIRQINNSIKKYEELKDRLSYKMIRKKQVREAWELAKRFFGQKIDSLEHNISTEYDYYNIIFNSHNKKHNLYGIVLETILIGLFDIYELSKGEFASYCALMLREKMKNLNDYSIILSCTNLFQQNGIKLNLGGSETKGLDRFKTKFEYYETNKMFWVCYI